MSAREAARHALYSELERVIGPEHSDTLMTHLPLHQSDQVATKSDISDLKADIKELEDIVCEQQCFYVATVVGSMTALTAIFSVVFGILR
jgi:hypothetical protein